MPTLILGPRQCELAIEAFLCLRTGRLQRDNPDILDAEELQKMADYLRDRLQPERLPRPADSPGRTIE